MLTLQSQPGRLINQTETTNNITQTIKSTHMKKFFTILMLGALSCGIAQAEPVSGKYTLYLRDKNNVEVADSFADTTISCENNVYTIHNIFDSGANLSFILPADAVVPEDATYNTYVAEPAGDNRVEYSNYFRIMDEDGNIAGATFYNCEGEEYFYEECPMTKLTFNPNRMKGYYYGDQEDEDGYTWAWVLSLAFYGLNDALFAHDAPYYASDWMFINAWIPNLAAEEGSVTGLASDTCAPQYYNLQGVRVMNPENGIYIMQKGNKVVKVAK